VSAVISAISAPLTCLSCRHLAWRVGRAINGQLVCTLTGLAAHSKCERFEYEPGTDEAVLWESLRGSAPNATGGLSSEAFVRQLRDAWDEDAP